MSETPFNFNPIDTSRILGEMRKNLMSDIQGSNFKHPKLNIINPAHEIGKKQVEKQDEILEFLKDITVKQSKTSKIQFYSNLFLAITTVVIGIIAIIPVFTDQNNNQYKNLYEHTITLEKKIIEQDYTISQLSIRLLDLQNQVQTLEKSKK